MIQTIEPKPEVGVMSLVMDGGFRKLFHFLR